MRDVDKERLIAAALRCREFAYAPYSQFRVGAAVLDENSGIFPGCNVENASYGLTICAERNAMAAAIAGGARKFTAIAVASANGVPPCGACRQFLFEFAPEMVVWLVDADDPGSITERMLSQLLPSGFRLEAPGDPPSN